ncbi:hypothetical protein CC2G_003395 [Coprinopsis cinerea AmutBmut pab1-1]|nr:hypothetical protein CC2G_003395 [Coprinopsis cinerea AmutBmut pab1-1]
MMVYTKGIFAVLLLALAQVSLAANPHLNRRHEPTVTLKTNAARMAAGLPPKAPAGLERRTWGHGGWGQPQPGWGWGQPPQKPGNPWDKGKDHDKGKDKDKGGKPKDPSPPKPSATKPDKPDCDDKKKVRIKCVKKGGGTIGYVGKDWSKKNKRGFGLCKDKNKALEVDFENSVTPFDMKIHDKRDFPFLGWSGNNLGSGNSAVLTGTRKTNIHEGPRNVGNAFSSWAANSESQVWYYSRNNRKFESKWVNTGGARQESKCFYNPDDDLFHLVSDTWGFLRRNPRAYEIVCPLIPGFFH